MLHILTIKKLTYSVCKTHRFFISNRDIKSIEIMIDLLRTRIGSTTSYTALANDLQVSIHTV